MKKLFPTLETVQHNTIKKTNKMQTENCLNKSERKNNYEE